MRTSAGRRHVFLQSLSRRSTTGTLRIGNLSLKCAIGRSGLTVRKREADGATPEGRLILRRIHYRADRGLPPATALPRRAIRHDDGWCDEPRDRNYNRPVRHPYPASAEEMWRQDGLYDVVVELGHNDRPRSRGCGSAIFMHLARPGYRPTAGCVALDRGDLLLLLSKIGRTGGAIVTARGRPRRMPKQKGPKPRLRAS
ncbi:MAG: L,D-transpeptidase family protein [Hyphomicrobium sp.]